MTVARLRQVIRLSRWIRLPTCPAPSIEPAYSRQSRVSANWMPRLTSWSAEAAVRRSGGRQSAAQRRSLSPGSRHSGGRTRLLLMTHSGKLAFKKAMSTVRTRLPFNKSSEARQKIPRFFSGSFGTAKSLERRQGPAPALNDHFRQYLGAQCGELTRRRAVIYWLPLHPATAADPETIARLIPEFAGRMVPRRVLYKIARTVDRLTELPLRAGRQGEGPASEKNSASSMITSPRSLSE